MSRISLKFDDLKSRGEKALIAYIMAGYPDENTTISAVRGLVKGGADIIELGFPFSDPLADGPIIQNASTISLEKGIKIKKFFEMVKKIRKETDTPLVLMTYTNVLYHTGYERFINMAKNAGIDGLILPDMAYEESEEYIRTARKAGVDTIFLISPNTTKSRIQKIAKISTGFLYLVAVFGTTGVRKGIQSYTVNALKDSKKILKATPVGIGFGVSTPKDVKKYVESGADAVIVGSAFLKLIETTPRKNIEKIIADFTRELKKPTKGKLSKKLN